MWPLKNCLDILFRKNLNSEGIFNTKILLSELPVPKENVSINQIIDFFKKQHKVELDNLQTPIINFELKIKATNSMAQLTKLETNLVQKFHMEFVS